MPALADEKRAIQAWRDIVEAAANVYNEKLPFGAPGYFPRHWKEELDRLESDFQRLASARQALPSRPATKPAPLSASAPAGTLPVARLANDAAAAVGRDFLVSATVTPSTDIKWVRLRYRHLTQYEDYETAPMTFDAAAHTYKGRIPASFIDPKWDLMYFVEVMDARGQGRMYPDLEKETPYVVVRVQR